MTDDLLQGFYLGDVLVEPLTGRVEGPHGSAHLPPRAAEVLLCLAHHAGEIVDRELLLESVWGAGRGSAEALSHAVGEIRHALGDHADHPAFIQTLPRRGYRLILPPLVAGDGSAAIDNGFAGLAAASSERPLGLFENLKRRGVIETALAYLITGWLIIQVADVVFDQLLLPRWAGTFVTVLVIAGFPIAILLAWFLEFRDGRAMLDVDPAARSSSRRIGRAYVAVIGAMTVASVGVLFYDQIIGLPAEPAVPNVPGNFAAELPVTENSIAVLPFYNIDGSERTRVFADGFAEDVTNRLARIPGLAVASRGDAWSLSPNSASSDVRRRLRVAYYLEGSVRLAGDALRVVVQLIDSESGYHIISRGFDRKLEDFTQVQKEVTDLTIANLRVALPPETRDILNADYADADTDVNAYVLYRKGKDIFHDPRTTESLDEAIGYFRRALELDPEYAAAHAGICDAYVSRYELGNLQDDIETAETACATALAANPKLHMVYAALGRLYRRTGRFDEAERAYEEALRINPRDVQAMQGLSSIYRRQQKLEEAEELLHMAIETQPGNWRTIDSLGSFLFRLGRFHEAADALRQAVFLNPDNAQLRGNFGSMLMMSGEFEEARIVLEQALEMMPDGRFYSNLGIIYYYLGRYERSIEFHRAAVEANPGTALLWLNLGDALYFAGNGQQAAEAFARAAEFAEQGLAVNPSSAELLFSLAWARQMQGDAAAAGKLSDRGLAIAPEDPYSFYSDALIKIRNSEHVAALASLRQAVQLGYPVHMLRAEPYLEPLRANPEFQQLVASSH